MNLGRSIFACAVLALLGMRVPAQVSGRLSGSGSVQLKSAATTRLNLKVQSPESPKEFALGQNYPNPFNPTTVISFDVPTSSKVTLKVYNLLGQEVATLLNDVQLDAGEQSIQFDASKLTSGVYFYRIQAGGFVAVRKMVLVR